MNKSNVKNSFLKGENNNFSYLSQITVKKCIINVPIKSALAVKISTGWSDKKINPKNGCNLRFKYEIW